MAFQKESVLTSMVNLNLTAARSEFLITTHGLEACADAVSRIEGKEVKNIDSYFAAVVKKCKPSKVAGAGEGRQPTKRMTIEEGTMAAFRSKLREVVKEALYDMKLEGDAVNVLNGLDIIKVSKDEIMVRFYDDDIIARSEVYIDMVHKLLGPYCGGRSLTFMYGDEADGFVIRQTDAIRHKPVAQAELFKRQKDYAEHTKA